MQLKFVLILIQIKTKCFTLRIQLKPEFEQDIAKEFSNAFSIYIKYELHYVNTIKKLYTNNLYSLK